MAGMTLGFIFGILYLLGGISCFFLAPIQKRAGKTKHFWAFLAFGVVMLVMAASSLLNRN
jgi:hypothetical protein